jgi:endonuclease YncB( thermonuclease family)
MSRIHLSPFLIMAPLAMFTALFVSDGGPPGLAWTAPAQPLVAATDPESARFGRCKGAVRVNCVVDGDTIWYLGTKIRLADINAPETGDPRCPAEAALGERATRWLTELLNAGSFSLEPGDRNRDSYGRQLRTISRGGHSLGAALVAEGLAEPWRGYRRNWC